MKHFLLLAVALAAPVVHASNCTPEILLAGTRDAVKGLAPGPVRKALEICFADVSATEHDRLTAAYLMTLSEDADLQAPNEPHLDYLAENDSRLIELGPDARFRAIRLVGDNAYENAKFDRAERAYRTLVNEAGGDLREYAVTKLGWTYMNVKRPDLARKLWADESATREARTEVPQTTWLHGWAQSLIEEGGKAASDIDSYCRIRSDDDTRAAFLRGTVDGLPTVTTTAGLRLVGETLARCKALYPAWLADIGERFASSSRACSLLSAVVPGTPLPQASALVEGCRVRLVRKDDDPSNLPPEVRDTIAHLNVEDGQRQPLFALATASQAMEQGCRLALDAYVSRAGKRETGPLDIDPKLAIAACENAVQKREAFASDIADQLEKAAFVGNKASLEDPRVFVTSQLLETPAFREAFMPKLASKPERWRETVYPALVAERLRNAESGAAQKLYDTYAAQNAGNAERKATSPVGGVWEELRIDRVTKLLDEKKYDDALALLRRDAPAATAKDRALRLWLRAMVSAPTDVVKKYDAEVTEVTAKSLDSKESRERLAGIELLARAERWDAVVASLPKLAITEDVPLLSDALVTGVFDAAVAGKVPPEVRCKGPQLAALIDAGRTAAAGKIPSATKATTASKRALPQAVTKLSNFGKQTERAASSKGDGTSQVSRWVDALSLGQRLVEKTAWPHAKLASLAKSTLGEFCQSRATALTALRRPSQLSPAEWASVTEELGKQLAACADAHGSHDNGGTR